MANQEHLNILNQGAKVWNKWRQEHPEIELELRGADLRHAILNGANLSGANLSQTNLWDAQFGNLNVGYADFRDANLSNAQLGGVDLSHVNLSGANLNGADLGGVNLSNANLNGADFTNAEMAGTALGDRDLRVVKGLEAVKHRSPSPLSINTIYLSGGDIPEVFLRGTGVPDSMIEYMRSLVGKPIDYYSCFISYSSKDETFAKRLYADLQSNNVRCWFAPEDLKWGARTRPSIDEAIRFHDKLLLILSKYSVASGWVEHEVKTALARERKEKRTVLFPVRIDTAVFDSPLSWATEIRHERNIGDFTCWKNHDDYQKAFTRLLRDLKTEAPRRL